LHANGLLQGGPNAHRLRKSEALQGKCRAEKVPRAQRNNRTDAEDRANVSSDPSSGPTRM